MRACREEAKLWKYPYTYELYQDLPCTLNWGYMAPNSGYLGPNRG